MNVGLTVHRSAHEIGGNCIEIADDAGRRIILDVGRPLDAPQNAKNLLPRSLALAPPCDGVLISHPHVDHYGLLEDAPAAWPIYSGAAAERLIKLTSAIFGKQLPHTFHSWKSGVPLSIGPFTLTPFLVDHSAFDAYMLLIDVHGKRILYSGDFRIHGLQSALTKRLMAAPPKDVDVLPVHGSTVAAPPSAPTQRTVDRNV